MTRNPPSQSRQPLPTPLAMSSAPMQSPIPRVPPSPIAKADQRPPPPPSDSEDRPSETEDQQQQQQQQQQHNGQDNASDDDSANLHECLYKPKFHFPHPKLRLEVRDLGHPGAAIFFSNVNAAHVLACASVLVLQTLYRPRHGPMHHPPVRSITVILRAFDGVAYATGSELDNDHKELHFSLDYIAGIQPPERQEAEITGVLVHEMTHMWQWDGHSAAPVGLTEGVADYVRLRNGYAPPHWRQEANNNWDEGYATTAYFLDWLQRTRGDDTVRALNERLGKERYDEEALWKAVCNDSVGNLWDKYKKYLKSKSDK